MIVGGMMSPEDRKRYDAEYDSGRRRYPEFDPRVLIILIAAGLGLWMLIANG